MTLKISAKFTVKKLRWSIITGHVCSVFCARNQIVQLHMTNGQFQSKFFEEQTYITQYDTQRQELDKKNSDSQKLGGGNMDVVQVMLCKHSSDCRSHILHSSQIIAAAVSRQLTITKHQPSTPWERCTVPKIDFPTLSFWAKISQCTRQCV